MNTSSKSVRPQILRRSKMVPEGTQFCNYSHRVCMQMRLDGYEYCGRHILEDKNSPFKQCQYISNKTSKRCTSAALRLDKKDGYCVEHGRRAAQIRYRTGRKRRPRETPSLLLDEFSHYTTKSSSGPDNKRSRSVESESAKIMEYMSSSDSETEPLTLDQVWRGDGDSDAESIDSEQEDPLKHAGVYTAEEVALITRDKLIRLQSLYIDQFKRLQHIMKEKRRQYLHTVAKERTMLGSVRQAKEDPKQRDKYDELVAMKRYHKRYGQEALLHRQSKERRIAVSEGINYRPPAHPKCIQSRHGGKCGARTVPLSKYCLQHILSDPHQTLYRPCNFAGQCRRPVLARMQSATCIYHCTLPDVSYRLPKKEEKDESKEEIDVVGGDDIKPEQPHQSLQLQIQIKQDELSKGLVSTARISNSSSDIKPTPVRMSNNVTESKPAIKPEDMTRSISKSHPTNSNEKQNEQKSLSAVFTPVSVYDKNTLSMAIPKRESEQIPELKSPTGITSASLTAEVPQVVNDLLEMEKLETQKSVPFIRQPEGLGVISGLPAVVQGHLKTTTPPVPENPATKATTETSVGEREKKSQDSGT